jgi:hypothetical protein
MFWEIFAFLTIKAYCLGGKKRFSPKYNRKLVKFKSSIKVAIKTPANKKIIG